ncbi:MAG TPA: phosphoribosylanthranilate isomerase [Terriglobales bacterium]|nr:phosphoribosylanthranilate isomerase [Terriglobales bacterium]
MTWVKICGTTNLEDALAAVEAGADALGFIFAPSPRRVEPEQARDIIRQLPRAIEKVGVFVDESAEQVQAIARQAGLTAVQVQGDEVSRWAALMARQLPFKLLVSCPMSIVDGASWAAAWDPKVVYAFLLDSGTAKKRGGTGKTFDWKANASVVEDVGRRQRVIIAGGLSPANVGEAVQFFRPWGVDVTSGVELEPGKKDHKKVHAFIEAARTAAHKEAAAEL